VLPLPSAGLLALHRGLIASETVAEDDRCVLATAAMSAIRRQRFHEGDFG
jgi:hypothetical protein